MYYLSMNELIKTLEKAKAQGRNVIWEEVKVVNNSLYSRRICRIHNALWNIYF